MSSVCPCKDCTNKGCGAFHSKCEKYLKWKEKYNNERRIIKESKATLHKEHLYFNS